jgi:hypothetical protein
MKQGTHTQSKALAHADENTTGNKAAKNTLGCKGLHEGSNNGEQTAETHTPTSAEVVGL